jgi:nucleotide-binding universal stress UspA family protein
MTASASESGSQPAAAGALVVGVDGSEGSLAALRWAFAEAAAHGAPVWAVHVLDPRVRRVPYARVGTPRQELEDDVARVERLIDQVALEARVPGGVRRLFEIGRPADVLINVASHARMLVLGHTPQRDRPLGEPRLERLAPGAVARVCAVRATCPVVVVPASEPVFRAVVPASRASEAASAPTSITLEGTRALYPRFRARPLHH